MRKLLLVNGLLLPYLSWAQSSILYFNHLTVNNGLSQGVANVTLKDSRGFVWISTLDGIDRFDGINCRHYDLSQLAKVNLTQTTTNFLEDKKGNIWAGTQHGLLYYNYSRDAFSYLSLGSIGIDDGYTSPDIIRISYIDDQNRLWLQRENHLYCFDINKHTSRELAVPALTRFPVVLSPNRKPFQKLDMLYVADMSSGNLHRAIIINDQPGWKTNHTDIPSHFDAAVITADDSILLVSKNILYKYCFSGNRAFTFQHLPVKSRITMVQASGNMLWIGTDNDGVAGVQLHTGQMTHWSRHVAYDNNSLLTNNISSILIDDASNLWASVWGQGISYANLTKFRMQQAFTRDEARTYGCDNFIRSIGGDSKGDIWCNTGSDYLLRFDNHLQFKEKVGLPAGFSHFIIDKHDRAWFGSGENIYSYSIRSRQVRPIKKSGNLEVGGINNVVQLKDGTLLFSCNFGIWMLDSNGLFKPLPGYPRDHIVNMVFENRKGQLFIGTDRIGMNLCARGEGGSYQIRKTFTFPGNVKCFYEQNDSLLWIASTSGLLLFNQQKEVVERIFTSRDGLPNNYLYTCLPDARGNLWITSNKGITSFNTHTYQCKNFNVQDGIQSNEFNSNAYLLTPDSAMVFGGVNGLNLLRPASITAYSQPASPQITLVKTDSLINPFSFEKEQSITLAYDKSNIEIGIAALEYANAPANRLKYILEGNESDWNLSANKGLIQYAHLSPGKYRFKLMAANCDGIWSNEVRTLNIIVLHPFWSSWWFITICVLAVSAILYAVYRFRLYQVLKMERLRMRLATDLHDDIGSTLSSISMYSEAVKKQVKGTMPQLEKVLDKMGESSRKMVGSMSDIVWAVNPDNDQGARLIERMEVYAGDACAVTDTTLHFICDPALRGFSFPLEYRKNIYLIFKEAVNNSLKYAAAADIWISLEKKGTQLHLLIKDNGKGFDTGYDYNGNGLKNLKMRAREIKGQLMIGSSRHEGTIIDLKCRIT